MITKQQQQKQRRIAGWKEEWKEGKKEIRTKKYKAENG